MSDNFSVAYRKEECWACAHDARAQTRAALQWLNKRKLPTEVKAKVPWQLSELHYFDASACDGRREKNGDWCQPQVTGTHAPCSSGERLKHHGLGAPVSACSGPLMGMHSHDPARVGRRGGDGRRAV